MTKALEVHNLRLCRAGLAVTSVVLVQVQMGGITVPALEVPPAVLKHCTLSKITGTLELVTRVKQITPLAVRY